ncbi:MAG: ABC transporter permease subunit [Clostridia bacterium]|nr:ABC transporter permease subunit [Clostridia bacterium]MDD6040951.1 ABC transporter permease subunit [Clostridia bacterium]
MIQAKRSGLYSRIQKTAGKLWSFRLLYLMILPFIIWYMLFCYVPMAGLYLSFEDFSYRGGIWGSKWVGMDNFRAILTDKEFLRAFRNTLVFSMGKLALQFPAAIVLALALNEVQRPRLKKTYQTVLTFPHFISWVVMAGILKNMFAGNGVINQVLTVAGLQPVSPLLSLTGFRPFIWFSNIWKEAGWDTIIYMAALAGIDPGLYEAAEIDGANRWGKIWHITLPGIRSTILIMLILEIGRIMTTGASFDQVFNLYSSPVYEVADTIDTYIYRTSFNGTRDFGYTTAVGLFKSVMGVTMMLGANRLVTACGEDGLF